MSAVYNRINSMSGKCKQCAILEDGQALNGLLSINLLPDVILLQRGDEVCAEQPLVDNRRGQCQCQRR